MLSLVIPTSNRPQFLARCLSYYEHLGVPYPMIIADSSLVPLAEANQRLCDAVRHRLDLRYERYDVEMPIANKLASILELVSSPYVVLGADDDFFVPVSLEEGVQFLHRHPDYALVHGEAVLVTLPPREAVYGRCESAGPYRQRAIDLPTASQRLTEHLRDYTTTFYAMHRTAQLLANWRITAGGSLDCAFVELLPSCLSVIQGKREQLPGLSLVRQGHSAQTSVHHLLDPFDWVADPRWAAQMTYVRHMLTEALMRQDGISESEAAEVIKQAFWGYLAHASWRKWRGRYDRRAGGGHGSRWREAARQVPGLRRTWRAVRSRLPGQACSLESLRRPSSRFYAAFLPIDEVLTDSRR